MPWTSDQVPWNFKYPKPPNPSGPWEPLNWMKGPPVLIGTGRSPNLYDAPILVGGGGPLRMPGGLPVIPAGPSGSLGGAPVMHGGGLKPYYPNRTTLAYQYNPPVMPGLSTLIQILRLKG